MAEHLKENTVRLPELIKGIASRLLLTGHWISSRES